MKRFLIILGLINVLASAQAHAESRYTFTDAFVRATPAKISAAYVIVENPSVADDTLQGVSADWAGRAELHTVTTDNKGVMTMAPVKTMTLPAHGQLTLRTGGQHVMLFDLKRDLKEGETVKMILHFKRAGDQTVSFAVKPITYTGKK